MLDDAPAPDRATHHAARRTIELHGEPAPRAAFAAFDYFNASHFEGRLGAPLILITPPASPRAGGDYIPRDLHGLESRIRVAPRVAALDEEFRYFIGVVLHEMVHAYQHEVLKDIEPGYRGHGPKFCAVANAIGKVYGFPEVAPRARNGKANPASWPNLPPLHATELPPPPPPDDEDDDAGEQLEPPPQPKPAPTAETERRDTVKFLRAAAADARKRRKGHTAYALQLAALALQHGAHTIEAAQ